jgi:hypothetical protein
MLQFNILLIIISPFFLVAWKVQIIHVTEIDLEGRDGRRGRKKERKRKTG